jgi:hypothetical protein
MGRYTDAIPILKQASTAFPNIMVTHLDLIQSYVELGRQEDAQAAAAELMRMSPQFTIASVPSSGRSPEQAGAGRLAQGRPQVGWLLPPSTVFNRREKVHDEHSVISTNSY